MSYSEEEGKKFIEEWFDKSVIPSLSEFISIPNLSRHFDKEYKTNGLLEKAGLHIKSWLDGLGIKGLKSQLLQPQDLTPFLFTEIQGNIAGRTVLFYGHFDKQPWGTGWDQNKGPTKPVIENNKLYGRGGVDDGFSIYTSALAIKALQQQNIPLPRIVFLTEGDQESGNHIEAYLERLKERIGQVDLAFVLDGGVVDYYKFWMCKSIRGYADFNLKIKILSDGVHSGDSSGIVPSTFKILNQLLSRLQNLQSGELIDFFQRDIPSQRYEQLFENSKEIGMKQFVHLKVVKGLKHQSESSLQTIIKKGWRPTLTVKALTGFPPAPIAGNLMLPEISTGISIRLPPTFREKSIQTFVRDLLTKNTPFNCTVQVSDFQLGEGWNSSSFAPWFEELVHSSSKMIFGSKGYSHSQGAGIPVVNHMANAWPKANIVVTGAVGPNANHHGPNENLDLPYTVKLARMIALVVGRSSAFYLSETK